MSEEQKKQKMQAAEEAEEVKAEEAEAEAEQEAETVTEEAEAEAETAEEAAEAPAEEPEAEHAASDADSEWNQKYIRLMADFQNYKRRNEKERADIIGSANEKIVTKLLTVLDNFERALTQECTDAAYAKGMDLIFRQLYDVLDKSGLEEIEALGEDFDPNFHHAVLTDDNDEYDSGKITEVLQKGYTLHGKVIRPAMVKVNN